eukprot:1195747-Prorocentrum_minimum.AAC.1
MVRLRPRADVAASEVRPWEGRGVDRRGALHRHRPHPAALGNRGHRPLRIQTVKKIKQNKNKTK